LPFLTSEPNLKQALDTAEARLKAAGVQSPIPEALMLLEAAVGVERSTLLTQLDRPLSVPEGARLSELLRRRVAREPLQHILGEAHFFGLKLAVTTSVLVPRPETERLVELVLAELRAEAGTSGAGERLTVLDVGCGSGAIALALKAERPDLEVWASDLSAEALTVARANAQALALDVTFRRSDLLAEASVAAAAARCAVLVSNPPYLPEADRELLPQEVRADPEMALFAGEDGLDVARRLLQQAAELLRPGALLALELDERNVDKLSATMLTFTDVRVESDLAGRRRFLLARR